METRNAPGRSLVPQEHGAYGQIALPILTALLVGKPSAAALALAGASVLGFLAHEPLLVVLGQRGRRALAEEGPRARRLLVRLSAVCTALGAAGIALAPPPARVAALVPVALAGIVALLVRARLEKTVPGEILVAAALASCGLAVALAGGAPLDRALAAWVTWVLAFSAAVFAVHAVLSRSRSRGGRDAGLLASAGTLAVLAAGALAAAGSLLPVAAAVALVPMSALSLALSLARVGPRWLREAGWGYIGAGAVTLAVLVLGLR